MRQRGTADCVKSVRLPFHSPVGKKTSFDDLVKGFATPHALRPRPGFDTTDKSAQVLYLLDFNANKSSPDPSTKERTDPKMKKRWIPFLLICLAAAFITGLRLGSITEAEQHQGQPIVDQRRFNTTIAVVNADVGAVVNGNRYNYSAAIINTLGADFVLVSPAMAQTGLANGTYGAIITFPPDVSTSILSFNAHQPKRVQLEFQINPELPERDYLELFITITELQMAINNTLASTYVSSIFRQFHEAQDQVDGVFRNTLADLYALEIITLGDFTATLDMDEIPHIPLNPIELNTTFYMDQVAAFANEVSSWYRNSYAMASDQFLWMREGLIRLTEDFPEQEEHWIYMLNLWTRYSVEYGELLEEFAAYVLAHEEALAAWHQENLAWSDALEDYQFKITDWHEESVLWFQNAENWHEEYLAFLDDTIEYSEALRAFHSEFEDNLIPLQEDITTWMRTLIDYEDGLNERLELFNELIEKYNLNSIEANEFILELLEWHRALEYFRDGLLDWKDEVDEKLRDMIEWQDELYDATYELEFLLFMIGLGIDALPPIPYALVYSIAPEDCITAIVQPSPPPNIWGISIPIWVTPDINTTPVTIPSIPGSGPGLPSSGWPPSRPSPSDRPPDGLNVPSITAPPLPALTGNLVTDYESIDYWYNFTLPAWQAAQHSLLTTWWGIQHMLLSGWYDQLDTWDSQLDTWYGQAIIWYDQAGLWYFLLENWYMQFHGSFGLLAEINAWQTDLEYAAQQITDQLPYLEKFYDDLIDYNEELIDSFFEILDWQDRLYAFYDLMLHWEILMHNYSDEMEEWHEILSNFVYELRQTQFPQLPGYFEWEHVALPDETDLPLPDYVESMEQVALVEWDDYLVAPEEYSGTQIIDVFDVEFPLQGSALEPMDLERPVEFAGYRIPDIVDYLNAWLIEQPLSPLISPPPRPDDFWASLEFMHDQLLSFDVDEFLTDDILRMVERTLQDYEAFLESIGRDIAFLFQDNIWLMYDIYFEYDHFLRSLRAEAFAANFAEQQVLQAAIYEFARAREDTHEDNINRLAMFAAMMPESRAVAGVNQDLVDFTIMPLNFVPLNLRDGPPTTHEHVFVSEPESMAEAFRRYQVIVFVALAGVFLGTALSSIVSYFNNKKRAEAEARGFI